MVVYTIFNDHTQWNISDETFYSKLAMIQLASKLTTFSRCNSLTVKGDKVETKNFARLHIGVPTTDAMIRKEGKLSMIGYVPQHCHKVFLLGK